MKPIITVLKDTVSYESTRSFAQFLWDSPIKQSWTAWENYADVDRFIDKVAALNASAKKRYERSRWLRSSVPLETCRIHWPYSKRRIFIATRLVDGMATACEASSLHTSLQVLFPAFTRHWGLILVEEDGTKTLIELAVERQQGRRVNKVRCADGSECTNWTLYAAGHTFLWDKYIMELAEHIINDAGDDYTVMFNNCQQLCRQIYRCIRIPTSMDMVLEAVFAVPYQFSDHEVQRQFREWEMYGCEGFDSEDPLSTPPWMPEIVSSVSYATLALAFGIFSHPFWLGQFIVSIVARYWDVDPWIPLYDRKLSLRSSWHYLLYCDYEEKHPGFKEAMQKYRRDPRKSITGMRDCILLVIALARWLYNLPSGRALEWPSPMGWTGFLVCVAYTFGYSFIAYHLTSGNDQQCLLFM